MTDGDDLSSSDPDLSAVPTASGDPLEALLRRVVTAPPELPALHTGDELVGRFRIDRLVGTGGMGAVYLAFDSTLERQVAIKLRHRDGAGDRLRREAVAMARLAHPNVITVFEVGTVGDQAFVAMEYVAGTTLRAWMVEPHSERERIAVLLAAGEGLAAAHAAGLIHRDFKPENVLMGDDGRPRVGDFGLARGSESRDEVSTARGAGFAGPATMTGAVMGTPAYMAPEQANGEAVDARADQFAFAVVAWELLSGKRPGGDTTPKRSALRAVLARGLSPAPADRYPDLPAMLAAIRRATRRRWPWLAVPAVAIGTTAAIVLAMQTGPAIDCDSAGAAITTLPRTLPDRLRALGTPFAIDAATRVQADIDSFADTYQHVAVQTCTATKLDHSWSADLGTRAQVCLEIARRQADVALSPHDVTRAGVAELVLRASGLPPLAACGDAMALAASPAVPADPKRLAETIDLVSRLGSARNDLWFHHHGDAKAAVAAIEKLPAVTESTVAPWLDYVRGEIAMVDDDLVLAERDFANAYFAARSAGDVVVTLGAIERLILSSGNTREDKAAAEGWIRNGVADADRSRRLAPMRAALVYATASRVRGLQDRNDDAVGLGATAVEIVGTTSSLQASDVLAMQGENLCAAGRYDDCFALETRSLAMARQVIGPKHPRLAQTLTNFALDREEANHPKEALDLVDQAREVLAETSEWSSLDLAQMENSLAAVVVDADPGPTAERARPMLVDARRRLVEALGEDHPDVAQVDSNLATVDLRGDHYADALEHARKSLASEEKSLGPVSARVADSLTIIALAHRGLGDLDAAIAAAKRAVTIRAAIAPNAVGYANTLVILASIENLRREHALAKQHAEAALAVNGMDKPIMYRGTALLEAARAQLGLGDPTAARKLVTDARAIFVTLDSASSIASCDQLVGMLHAR